MRLLKLAYHLQDKMPELKVGENLYVTVTPPNVVESVLIRDGYAGAKISGEIRALRQAPFQIVVRGKHPQECFHRAQEISDALETEHRTDIDNMHIHHIRATTEPIPYPFSQANIAEVVVNFSMSYVIVRQ